VPFFSKINTEPWGKSSYPLKIWSAVNFLYKMMVVKRKFAPR